MSLQIEKRMLSERHKGSTPAQTNAYIMKFSDTRAKEKILNISTPSYKIGHIIGQGNKHDLGLLDSNLKDREAWRQGPAWRSFIGSVPCNQATKWEERNIFRPQNFWKLYLPFLSLKAARGGVPPKWGNKPRKRKRWDLETTDFTQEGSHDSPQDGGGQILAGWPPAGPQHGRPECWLTLCVWICWEKSWLLAEIWGDASRAGADILLSSSIKVIYAQSYTRAVH